LNKRYLDHLRALLYYFYSRLHELKGSLISIRKYTNDNPVAHNVSELFDAYRASCINHDEFGQAVILNLLLRNFLAFSEYEAAQNLLSKTKFPENKFNNEFIRYLYYKGRVRAVQGEYQEAFALVQQAIRKAPEKTALGFRLEAQKLACVVELLLGDLPARNIFAAPDMKSQLIPYFKLVKGVAVGNLDDFYNVVRQNHGVFTKDRNLNLINRLHQNVIKTGLRRINLSYSKISLHDIAEKLKIHTHHSDKDVEFVVAKAIRDGTMIAHIDHETKSVVMSQQGDVYETQEPQVSFQKRIAYCLHVHTAAIKVLVIIQSSLMP
jgi:26S proteasome regulatory subunit N3